MDLQIKPLRIARSMTALELASHVGIGRPYMSNIENGNGNPTLDVLERIAKALGVEPVELFFHTANPLVDQVFGDKDFPALAKVWLKLSKDQRRHLLAYTKLLIAVKSKDH